MDVRYTRNFGAITREEQQLLHSARVCIAGCGGLGGYLIEYLGRIGVGYLTVVDGDRFDRTNLNRQILSSEENLGQPKVAEAQKRLTEINPSIQVRAVNVFLTEDNAASILQGHDLVLDALDSIHSRLMLQKICSEQKLPLIHGAVEGWFGQVTTIFPGDDSLCRLYPGCKEETVPEKGSATLSFAPAFIASVQVSEAVKVLLGKNASLRGKVLFADLLQNRFDIMPL